MDDDTLRSAVEATMAARREALGEPPSPEELLAFRDHTLPAADRDAVEEKIAAFPEAAAALVDLARFPDVPAAPEVREVDDEEIAADWERLRRRMARERQEEAPSPARRPAWPAAALLAAGLFAGVVGGVLLARGPLAPPPAPAAGAALVALVPDHLADLQRGGDAVVDPGEPLVLALAAGGIEPRPVYALTLADAGGRTVWSAREVAASETGLVTVELPAGFLAPGRYRIELSAPEGGAPLATFTLAAVEPAGR